MINKAVFVGIAIHFERNIIRKIAIIKIFKVTCAAFPSITSSLSSYSFDSSLSNCLRLILYLTWEVIAKTKNIAPTDNFMTPE